MNGEKLEEAECVVPSRAGLSISVLPARLEEEKSLDRQFRKTFKRSEDIRVHCTQPRCHTDRAPRTGHHSEWCATGIAVGSSRHVRTRGVVTASLEVEISQPRSPRASSVGYVRCRVFRLYMVGEGSFLSWYIRDAYASVCT